MKLLNCVVLASCLALCSWSLEGGSPTISKPKFDPDARQVELFEAIEAGSVEAWLIPHSEARGYVYVENKTDEPLTVRMPKAFVGVQNLKQLFGNGNGNGNGFGNGNFGNNNGNQQGGGGNQPVGGGIGQNNQNNNNFNLNNGPGNNNFFNGTGAPFFSIPAQRRVKLEFNSVCLAHGLKIPNKTRRYALIPFEKFSQDEKLHELLTWVSTGKVPQKTAQAATWHLTDGMSQAELARKQIYHLGGLKENYFHKRDLKQAGELLDFVDEQIAARKQNKDERDDTALAEIDRKAVHKN